ncbi:hypothetical protein ID866_9316 [Astraeus odoratus]|nr:hypothetical protein ID866_9316 [Astraeus odoratus]
MWGLSAIPQPVEVLSPELADVVKQRTEDTLLSIIKMNRCTRYFRESAVLDNFRSALESSGNKGDDVPDNVLLDNYCAAIPLTNYEDYEPFIDKFIDKTCREGDVCDMFSPGLPQHLNVSSSTSSGRRKFFPQYHDRMIQTFPGDNPGKTCATISLTYYRLIDIQNENGEVVKKILAASSSSCALRKVGRLNVEDDISNMKLPGGWTTSPVAVNFIPLYRSFMLMHALFALADRDLENISTIFATYLLDMIRLMEEEWHEVVSCIETGKLPDWEGIDAHHFPPRPERASELRAIGNAHQESGWLAKIWPKLKTIIANASGVFSSAIPKIRHYIGPDVQWISLGLLASEAFVGITYHPQDLNLFKVASEEFIEYLDILREENISSLVAPWKVEFGKKYEIVPTTRDGLWRYRLGDIVEIAGFDPADGSPIVRYIGRRNVVLRMAGTMFTEACLTESIFATQDTLGQIAEFTVAIDDRGQNPAVGYFVEIYGEIRMVFLQVPMLPVVTNVCIDPEANAAPALLRTELCRLNETFRDNLDRKMSLPTIRVVSTGTFREYRRWKVEMNGSGYGQTKVPVVMWDSASLEWMLARVERELVT